MHLKQLEIDYSHVKSCSTNMLDLQTLSISSVIAAVISALFFIVVWRTNRNTAGIGLWLIAVLLQPVGWLLLSMRGEINNWLSIIVGNIAILTSMIFFCIGTRAYLQRKNNLLSFGLIYLIFFTIALVYLTFGQPNISARIFLMYGTTNALMLVNVFTVVFLPKFQKTTGAYVFMSMSLVIAVLTTIRLLSLFIFGHQTTLFNYSFGNLVGSLLGFIIPYGMVLSIYILCNEQRIKDIEELKHKAIEQAKETESHLALLSHELRTPLNAMVGKAQLLQHKVNSSDQKEDCDVIVDSGKSLADLASQVLQYTSFNHTDGIKNRDSEIELKPFINNIIDLLRPLADARYIHIESKLIHAPKKTVCDKEKLRQILINLLGNAIKFTNDGSVSLVVTLNNQSQLAFTIIDTGIGVPHADQANLLVPFKQGSNHYKLSHRHTGVGLGLTLTQQLLVNMGSYLTFHSEEGNGSKFHFTLPIKKINATTAISQCDEIPPITGLKILLIEDIKLNQDVACAMLYQDQHKVYVASTAAEAKANCQTTVFDLILLDMQLPDQHGVDLYREIKLTDNLNQSTSVVALTATITPKQTLSYQEEGIIYLIEKPILMDKLRKVIRYSTQPTNISSTTQSKHDYPLLKKEPLLFLLENLPSQYTDNLIEQASLKIHQYIKNAIAAHSQQHQTQLDKICHSAYGYVVQLGLMKLGRCFQLLQNNQNPIAIEAIEELLDVNRHSILALKNYIRKYHASK